jgi:hypothetical protein
MRQPLSWQLQLLSGARNTPMTLPALSLAFTGSLREPLVKVCARLALSDIALRNEYCAAAQCQLAQQLSSTAWKAVVLLTVELGSCGGCVTWNLPYACLMSCKWPISDAPWHAPHSTQTLTGAMQGLLQTCLRPAAQYRSRNCRIAMCKPRGMMQHKVAQQAEVGVHQQRLLDSCCTAASACLLGFSPHNDDVSKPYKAAPPSGQKHMCSML